MAIQRTLSMIAKNCDGNVPTCNWDVFDANLQYFNTKLKTHLETKTPTNRPTQHCQ